VRRIAGCRNGFLGGEESTLPSRNRIS
jgi:hypothetical protein